jgi:hypothetical protein
LLLKDHPQHPERKRLLMIAKGPEIDLGAGPGTEDDPVAHGGRLRMWMGSDLVGDYPLVEWTYSQPRHPERGYRFEAGEPIRNVRVVAGKLVRIVGLGTGLGYRLGATPPEQIVLELTLGSSIRYCIEFGGAERFKPERKLLRKGPVRATRCDPAASVP